MSVSTQTDTKQPTPDEITLRDAKRIVRTIDRHLSENRCNHNLREIVKEALE